MGLRYEFIEKQDYRLGFFQENIEMLLYSGMCFFIPFLIGHPQLLVGTMVNAALVLAALNLKKYKLLPIIIVPSLAVLSRGIIFGPFTIYLVYMIPFIWIGNSILVLTIKELRLKRKMNRFLSLGVGAGLKALFLFTSAYILFSLGIIPIVFLTAMGITQLYTALAGGLLAFGTQAVKKKII